MAVSPAILALRDARWDALYHGRSLPEGSGKVSANWCMYIALKAMCIDSGALDPDRPDHLDFWQRVLSHAHSQWSANVFSWSQALADKPHAAKVALLAKQANKERSNFRLAEEFLGAVLSRKALGVVKDTQVGRLAALLKRAGSAPGAAAWKALCAVVDSEVKSDIEGASISIFLFLLSFNRGPVRVLLAVTHT